MWVLMVGTLLLLYQGPDKPPLESTSWKAYAVDSFDGCVKKLAEVRKPDTTRANCHDNSRSAVYSLVEAGQDNPNPKAMIDGKEAP